MHYHQQQQVHHMHGWVCCVGCTTLYCIEPAAPGSFVKRAQHTNLLHDFVKSIASHSVTTNQHSPCNSHLNTQLELYHHMMTNETDLIKAFHSAVASKRLEGSQQSINTTIYVSKHQKDHLNLNRSRLSSSGEERYQSSLLVWHSHARYAQLLRKQHHWLDRQFRQQFVCLLCSWTKKRLLYWYVVVFCVVL